MKPADENDTPVFEGRFNLGAISLHLPMILAKAREEGKDFYEVLDYYLELIRKLHIKTFNFLAEKRASINPLAFCEGGFYKGHLKPDEKILEVIKPATMSFGITALNELEQLYHGKSLVEDGSFALEVMEYINQKVNKFKEEDGILYAIYGTPAESLCFTGDTVVQTYGGNKQIKDLKVNDLVYSFNEKEHKIELKRVLMSKKTVENAELIEVAFDNGQVIRCTPNHKFGVRVSNKDPKTGLFTGGEHLIYIEAKNLKKNDRIKSNYIYLNSSGRPECSNYYKGRKQLVQDINAEFILGEKPEDFVTHHIDQNKENNLFNNLKYLSQKEHKKLHLKDNIQKHCFTSESQKGENNSFYGKHHSDESKKKNREAHIGKSVEVFSLDMNFVKHYDCLEDVRKDGYTRHLAKKACNGVRKHLYKNLYWFYTNDCKNIIEKNHKVFSVRYLDIKEDVYDIEVEDNHNFFVGGNEGILVHNCGLQVEQFRKKYDIIKNVSDKLYVSNSFHCHVTENITPVQKQDLENRFWNLFNGGKIQYVRYPIDYNLGAFKTLVRRAMKLGFYEGINLSLSYCEDCGYEQLEMDECPKCHSKMITKIDRMNGYLGYTRVHGDTRYNEAKNAEIADRVSM